MGKFKRNAPSNKAADKKSHRRLHPQSQVPAKPPKAQISRRQYSQNSDAGINAGRNGRKSSKSSDNTSKRGGRVKAPFSKWDNVLLVGEGDFSFTSSLVQNYRPWNVVATCYDSEETLKEKYPHVVTTLDGLFPGSERSAYKQDSVGLDINSVILPDHENEEEWGGFSPESSSEEHPSRSRPQHDSDPTTHKSNHHTTNNDMAILPPISTSSSTNVTIHYSIDATRLNTTHRKLLLKPSNGKGGSFSKIVFNFPHVGGLSTDVNRQVRSNQQLLVSFLNAARSLLATPERPAQSERSQRHSPEGNRDAVPHESEDDQNHDDEDRNNDHEITNDNSPTTTLPSSASISPLAAKQSPSKGQILITLFTGQPYELWNIRDLARHTGYQIIESFQFPWDAYPGYHHARTLGEVVSRQKLGRGDQVDDRYVEREGQDGKRPGKWRGEEREARCFVLVVRDEERSEVGQGNKRKINKRKGDDDEDEEEDDEEDQEEK